MSRKSFKKILFEEIDQFVENLSFDDQKKTKQIINELFTMNKANLLKNMGAQDPDDENESVEMDSELWDWFLDTCSQSIQEEPEAWIKLLHKEKLKTLCYKYFTKQELLKVENIESDVRIKIRKYFSALQNFKDLNQFREKISNLPSELLTNFTRYLLMLSPDLRKKLVITKNEFKKRVRELKEERMKMIEKISLVSKKYQSILNLTKIKELYDNGCFFEDNLLNRGVNEYIVKLLNYDKSNKQIKNSFSNTFVNDLLSQSENSGSYAQHVESIKQEIGHEFFNENGFQIGNRYENEIENAKSKDTSGEIIDKKSIYKEPTGKIKDVALPWETNEEGTGEEEDEKNDKEEQSGEKLGGGGGFSGGGGGSMGGGGDFSFEEPDEGIPAEDIETDETIGGGTGGGTMGTMDTETDLPSNEEGFPVDFGSEESNPEATEGGNEGEENSGMDVKANDNEEEQKDENG